MADRMIRLSDASARLHVPYQTLYLAVAAGRVAAERDASGNRWLVAEEALPQIAEVLGLGPGGAGRSPELRGDATK